MRAILLSVKPEWVAKILNGEKTIDIRKTMPKCELPIDVYIYCTKSGERPIYLPWEFDVQKNDGEYISDCDFEKGNGKVVAKFTLNKVEEITCRPICGEWESYTKTLGYSEISQASCLRNSEIVHYCKGNNGYAWYISDLEIFDKPKKLREFEKVGSYNNPTIKCKGKERGRCNYGISPFTGKFVGCEKAKLTKAPRSWCYVEN